MFNAVLPFKDKVMEMDIYIYFLHLIHMKTWLDKIPNLSFSCGISLPYYLSVRFAIDIHIQFHLPHNKNLFPS